MIFTIAYYFVLSIILFIFLFLSGYYLYQKYSRFYSMMVKIPAAPAFPILGHAVEFGLTNENPWYLMRKAINTYKPIMALYSLHFGGAILLNLEDVEKLLSSTKYIRKGVFYQMLIPWLNTGLLTSTGEKWFHRRKILTPTFHFSILQNFLAVFNKETQKLVEKLEKLVGDPNIDIIPIVSQFTLSSIAETAMGTTLDEDERCCQYRETVHEIGDMIAYRTMRPWLYNNFFYGLTSKGLKSNRLIKFLQKFTRSVIKKKEEIYLQQSKVKAAKKLAMLDLLLSVKHEDRLIDNEGIREEVDTFMFEGHDTTSVAITYLLLMLAHHQDVQTKCYEEILSVLANSKGDPTYSELQEMSYIERCIKEVLRLYPSVPQIFRTIDEDFVTVSGHIIPKGADITIPFYDIHRNPEVFPDPETFDPDRFLPENCKSRHPYAYIPFSAGPRNCIGQKFAMLEIKSLICGILRKFRLEPITNPEEIIFRYDLVLRSIIPIKVKFVFRTDPCSKFD